jgi:hypothetical protein
MDSVQFPRLSSLLGLTHDVSDHAGEIVHYTHSAISAAKMVRILDDWVTGSQAYQIKLLLAWYMAKRHVCGSGQEQ